MWVETIFVYYGLQLAFPRRDNTGLFLVECSEVLDGLDENEYIRTGDVGNIYARSDRTLVFVGSQSFGQARVAYLFTP